MDYMLYKFIRLFILLPSKILRPSYRNRALSCANLTIVSQILTSWVMLLSVATLCTCSYAGVELTDSGCYPCENPDWFLCEGSCVCIPLDKKCDGSFSDCSLKDFSDEKNCPAAVYNSTCGEPVYAFPCHDVALYKRQGSTGSNKVKCLSPADTWVCDGTAHCDDGTDESPEVCSDCPDGWFKCGSFRKCIPDSLECNGIDDCGNGFDEENCHCRGVQNLCSSSSKNSPAYLGCGTFQTCNSVHPCFPFLPTHESRSFCESSSVQYSSKCLDKEGYIKCHDHLGLMRCIEKHLVCDGIPHCQNGTDESPQLCSVKHKSDSNTFLKSKDICFGACDHNCASASNNPDASAALTTNALRGSECSCNTDYRLSSKDKFSCIAQDSSPARLYAAGDKLISLDITGEVPGSNPVDGDVGNSRKFHSTHSKVVADRLNLSSPLALHVEKSLAFFVETEGHFIRIYNLRTGKIDHSIRVASTIGGIAVDWVHDLLFWTEQKTGIVMVSSLDGTKSQQLYSGLNNPTCILAVPEKAYLVVCERPLTYGRIIQLSMDGQSQPKEFISGSDYRWVNLLPNLFRSLRKESLSRKEVPSFKRFSPTSLAFDYAKSYLYFVENHLSIVAAIDVTKESESGFELHLLTHEHQFENQKLFGAEIFNNKLYLSEVRSKIVYELYPLSARMNEYYPAPIMTGTSVNLSLPQSFSIDLKVFHPSRQPKQHNHCPETKPCSYMCLPSYGSFKCICPSGHRLVFETECELIIEPFLILATIDGLYNVSLPLSSYSRPQKLVTSSSFHSENSKVLSSEGAGDIDWHPNTNRIYWTDPGSRSLQSVSYDGLDHQLELTGLGKPWGIAVDYMTDKVFWSDIEKNTISALDLRSRKRNCIVLVWVDMSSPKYISLDLNRGYLYWADSGKPYRIERSRMDGSGRKTVKAIQDLPSKLIISMPSEKFFFMAGQQINVVTKSSPEFVFSKLCCDDWKVDSSGTFDVFNHTIFTTSDYSTIMQCAINQSESFSSSQFNSQSPQCQMYKPQFHDSHLSSQFQPSSANRIKALSLFHQQKPTTNRLFCTDKDDNAICEHFCFLSSNSFNLNFNSNDAISQSHNYRSDPSASSLEAYSPLCACFFGFQPNPVNHTRCIPRTDDVLLISSGQKLEIVYFSHSDMTQYPQLSPLTPDTPLYLWEYSPVSRTVVYYDANRPALVEADIRSGLVLRKFLESFVIRSFALDYTHQLVFFVNSLSETIKFCKIGDCNQPHYVRTLVSTNITKPRSLLLDAKLGIIFWYDTNERARESQEEGEDFPEYGFDRQRRSANEGGGEDLQMYGSINQIDMTGDPGSRRTLIEFCLSCGRSESSDDEVPNMSLTIDVKEQSISFIDLQGIVNKVKYYSSEISTSSVGSQVEQTISLDERELSSAGLTALNRELFWVERRRKVIGMYDRYHLTTSLRGSLSLLDEDEPIFRIAAYSHKERIFNQCENISCSYICVPTFSRIPRCLCPPGVWLSSDNITCETTPRQFIITPHSVLLPEVMTSNLHHDVTQPTTHFTCQNANFGADVGVPVSIDYHYRNRLIFVATNRGIYQYDFNLNNMLTVKHFPSRSPSLFPSPEPFILGLAVDWVADNLYWLSIDGMFASKLDGSGETNLRSFAVRNGKGGLVIHPARSFIFWSHPAATYVGIHKSHLNLDDDEQFWRSDLSNPDHMTIDYENNHIYWVMREVSKLYFSDFNGKHVQTLDSLFKSPVALTVFGNITYCIDVRPNTASSAPQFALTQCNLNTLFHPNNLTPSRYPFLEPGSGFGNDSLSDEQVYNESAFIRESQTVSDSEESSSWAKSMNARNPYACSSVEACYMNQQSTSQFTALTFVSPLQQTLSKEMSLFPCAVENGVCGSSLCLTTSKGYVCKCPTAVAARGGACVDRYEPPDNQDTDALPGLSTDNPHSGHQSIPDFEEQIRMILVIAVFAVLFILVLVVIVIMCLKRYHPRHSQPDYNPTLGPHAPLHLLNTPASSAHFTPGGAIVNPRMPLMGTLRASPAFVGPRGFAPGATAVVHHNAMNGNVYHSLPRRNHCSLAPDNYVMPQNTRRYSTHSLPRNSLFNVQQGFAQRQRPNNYIDLQSHLLSIPTGPAGVPQGAIAVVSSNQASGTATPIYMWTPNHMTLGNKTATLSNKNLNKATLNHLNQQILQQQHQQYHQPHPNMSSSHSPTASFSSQGSRHTAGSSHHLGTIAMQPTSLQGSNQGQLQGKTQYQRTSGAIGLGATAATHNGGSADPSGANGANSNYSTTALGTGTLNRNRTAAGGGEHRLNSCSGLDTSINTTKMSTTSADESNQHRSDAVC